MFDRVLRALAYCAGAVLLGLMALVLFDVLMRYVLRLPFLGGFHDLSVQLRTLLGLTYRLGLDEALERFKLDWEGPPHDALADARNLARLFMAVAQRLR